VSIVLCVRASDASPAAPQSERTPSAPLPGSPQVSQCRPAEVRDNDLIRLAGCLAKGNEGFYFSDYSGQQYNLIGNDSLLSEHAGWSPGKNVCVQGTISSKAFTINVTGISDLPRRVASLNPSIGPPSQWRQHTNKPYGLSFRLPESFPVTNEDGDKRYNDQYIQPNFPVEGGAITLAKFTIGGDAFTTAALPHCDEGRNFFDGRLDIFVNPEITNSGSCYQFGQSDPKYTGSQTLNGTEFSETTDESIGTGHYYHYDYYNTFQNGLCYEFVFSDYSTATNPDDPCSCTDPVVKGRDELVRTILSQLSFPKPEAPTIVPKSYSGSGFRIFVYSEDRVDNRFVRSCGVSPPFNIVQ
jgi:hypothetical protein